MYPRCAIIHHVDIISPQVIYLKQCGALRSVLFYVLINNRSCLLSRLSETRRRAPGSEETRTISEPYSSITYALWMRFSRGATIVQNGQAADYGAEPESM